MTKVIDEIHFDNLILRAASCQIRPNRWTGKHQLVQEQNIRYCVMNEHLNITHTSAHTSAMSSTSTNRRLIVLVCVPVHTFHSIWNMENCWYWNVAIQPYSRHLYLPRQIHNCKQAKMCERTEMKTMWMFVFGAGCGNCSKRSYNFTLDCIWVCICHIPSSCVWAHSQYVVGLVWLYTVICYK